MSPSTLLFNLKNICLTTRDIESLHEINQIQNKAHRSAVRLFNATLDSDVNLTGKSKIVLNLHLLGCS